jgi:molybdopterin-guanine dinucleotide biosynthesis protein A
MKAEPVAAIILAGGKSRRMNREKPLLPLNGRTLIEAVIAQVRLCVDVVLISAGDRDKFAPLRLPVIEDEAPGQGPLLAILTALRASPCETNIIMACDIPVIHLPFLERIVALAPRHEIVVPRYRDGKFEPLFAAYRRAIIPAIEKQVGRGDLKISSLFPACRTKFVAMDGQKWFRNLNTLEEYHDYLRSEKKAGD